MAGRALDDKCGGAGHERALRGGRRRRRMQGVLGSWDQGAVGQAAPVDEKR